MNVVDNAKDLFACATNNLKGCTLIADPNSGFVVALALAIVLMLGIAVAATMFNLLLVDFFLVRIRTWKALPWLIAIPSLVIQFVIWLEFSVDYFKNIESYFVWMFYTPLFAVLPITGLIALFAFICHILSSFLSLSRQVWGFSDELEPATKFRRLYLSAWVTVPLIFIVLGWGIVLDRFPQLHNDPLNWGPGWLKYGMSLWPVEFAVDLIWSLTLWLGTLAGLLTVSLTAVVAAITHYLLPSLVRSLRRRPASESVRSGGTSVLAMLISLINFFAALIIGFAVIFGLGIMLISSGYLYYSWIGAAVTSLGVMFIGLITLFRRKE